MHADVRVERVLLVFTVISDSLNLLSADMFWSAQDVV